MMNFPAGKQEEQAGQQPEDLSGVWANKQPHHHPPDAGITINNVIKERPRRRRPRLKREER
jgi:hypothetical protein